MFYSWFIKSDVAQFSPSLLTNVLHQGRMNRRVQKSREQRMCWTRHSFFFFKATFSTINSAVTVEQTITLLFKLCFYIYMLVEDHWLGLGFRLPVLVELTARASETYSCPCKALCWWQANVCASLSNWPLQDAKLLLSLWSWV